ncbi:hypothetical protein SAMN05660776_2881 [Salegentibacter holothuriorum]|uniref:EcsC protein family protein n=1 Tax=Salegentibacter holothuriorum TaxID=241145 RepID=A0A1T5DZ94_9FLAO|nr:hypothetical protein [Salegentibacter holothuriorum]SKB76836.1 hypothetical protein SAMN05660776_2881 [Salegentibacter holothuriorum]
MKDGNLIYYKILNKSLNIPGARVNRVEFLEKNLQKYCTVEQIEKAKDTSIIKAGIPEVVLEKTVRSVVQEHTFKVTGISTLTGMPGGLVMVATIPADLAQYYYHVIVLAQKLAFLYGYPQFKNDGSDYMDDDLVHHLTLFIGVMYEVEGADKAVLEVSKDHNSETISKVPGKTLTETAYYMLRKNIARFVGLKITKKTINQGISKVIPIVSGLVSGGVSYFSFTPMAEKLRVSLKNAHESRKDEIVESI